MSELNMAFQAVGLMRLKMSRNCRRVSKDVQA